MTLVFAAFVVVGLGAFLFQVTGQNPGRAWQAYFINFLLWSAVAQGAFLFSVVLHTTKARWGKPLQGLAESFAAFFPLSFFLFLFLFLGKEHIFPWLNGDVHGKAAWLNLPFLFSRDAVGLALLYGSGLAYLYYALRLKKCNPGLSPSRSLIREPQIAPELSEEETYRKRMTVWGVVYIIAFAVVLTLMAFDLVMSMEPVWVSTLFGAYAFVKAFYIGLAALIILANCIHLAHGSASGLTSSQFHDTGKLLFGFCLLWADFFYCQFLVIWYGNLPEETSYIIARTMTLPWKSLAWAVFGVSFIIPFFVLLNRKVKTNSALMIGLCSMVLIGIWLEHLLLVGPGLNPKATSLPLGVTDGLISLGFLGLMALAIRFGLSAFPRLIQTVKEEVK
jgi:hypothetical protein